MRKYKKNLACVLAVGMSIIMTGCVIGAKKETSVVTEDQSTIELRQNDYRGGITRLLGIKELVLQTVNNMKSNNDSIRTDKPNSYWDDNGFEDFVTTFLDSELINDTIAFNEEETTWEYVVNYIKTNDNSFTKQNSDGTYTVRNSSMTITRNEKDDYSIGNISSKYEDISGTAEYHMLYDCDKDWVKCTVTLTPSNEYPSVTISLLEYGRVDSDTFVIQTNTERLLVRLESEDSDTDLRERTIKEFYYTKLSGGIRTTFSPVEYYSEFDEDGVLSESNIRQNNIMSEYADYMNNKGDLAKNYGYTDSIFLNKSDISYIDEDWVLADKSLSQAVIYKNDALVVVTYNKLAEIYERFIYVKGDIDETNIESICNMIEIKDLKGLNADISYSYTGTEAEEDNDEYSNPNDPAD